MDLHSIPPEQILVGHVGGQLVLAAAAEDEALFQRIMKGYMSVGGDALELLAWLAREAANLYELHFGDGWQERIRTALLDVEADLEVAVNEEREQHDDPKEEP